jgi:ketosteroid isomerase-like protein
VLLLATHHAHGRSSGTPVAHQSGWIYEIYDGKITRCDAYYFSEEALAAAGMSE